jgi:hypothetical protein
MSVQEMLAQIPSLSFEERVQLIESLARSLRESRTPLPRRGVPASEVRGMIKPDGPIPTDEEIKEDYVNYLMEKYS